MIEKITQTLTIFSMKLTIYRITLGIITIEPTMDHITTTITITTTTVTTTGIITTTVVADGIKTIFTMILITVITNIMVDRVHTRDMVININIKQMNHDSQV